MSQSQTNSATIERRKEAIEGDFREVSGRVGEQPEAQNKTSFSDNFDTDSEQFEDPNANEELEEAEDMGLSMGM